MLQKMLFNKSCAYLYILCGHVSRKPVSPLIKKLEPYYRSVWIHPRISTKGWMMHASVTRDEADVSGLDEAQGHKGSIYVSGTVYLTV